NGNDMVRDTERRMDRQRDTVALHAGQKKAGADNRDNGKGPCKNFGVETFQYIKCRATAGLSIFHFFVHLPRGGLDDRGRTAEKGNCPHPEYRSGTAHADSRGYTRYITGTDPSGYCQGKSLE